MSSDKRGRLIAGRWAGVFLSLAVLAACSNNNDCVQREASRKLPQDTPWQPVVQAPLAIYGADADSDGVIDVFDLAPQDQESALPPVVAETEFNNNIADADPVGRNIPFTLTGTLANGVDYRIDSDYFSFTATAGARVAVIVFVGTIGSAGIEPVSAAAGTPRASVLDDTGAPVAGRSISTRSSEGTGLVMPKDGTYYVEISDVRIAAEEYEVPWVALVLPDADLDGLDGAIEARMGSDPERADSDGDGLDDSLEIYWFTALGDAVAGLRAEAVWDPDGDGIAAWLDVDSDGDGLADALEGADDADGDGLPNFLDSDANGDTIPDQRQAGASYRLPADQDRDGVPDFLDDDVDGDGLANTIDRLEKPAGDACSFYVADKPEYAWDDDALVAASVRAVSDSTVLPGVLVAGWRFEVVGRNFSDGIQVEVPSAAGSVTVTPTAAYPSLLSAVAPESVSSGTADTAWPESGGVLGHRRDFRPAPVATDPARCGDG